MTLMYKLVAGLIVLAVTFAGGAYYGRGDKQIEIQEKIVTKEGETKTVFRDRVVIVTKVVHPDGTVEEKTETRDSDKVVEKKKTSTKADTDTTVRPALAQYRLGLSAVTSWDRITERPTYEITGGVRAGNLPIWIRAGTAPGLHQITLGLEIEL